MQLHEKIGLMRRIKGWSQEAMSEKLGMSPNGYAKIERGETDVQWSRLEKIASILEIEMKELITFEGITILNVASSHDQSHMNNYVQHYVQSTTTQSEWEHELKLAKVMLEQKDKEILFLEEICALLRQKQPRKEE